MRINQPMDSLPDMAVFARVVDAGSFSAAARQLGITPSAVSRQVARLEGALRVRLLERTTRKLRLTDAGTAVYSRCQDMVSAAREVWALSDTHSAAPSGMVRMSMPKAVGRQLVHPLVLPFLQQYPQVDVQLLITDRTVDLLEEPIDLALRVTDTPPPGLAEPSACIVSTLMRSCIAMPRGAGTGAARPSSASVAPLAMRSCSSTRSSPVTASVTVCSTCRRGFASMKKKSPLTPSTRNSKVPRLR